MYYLPIKADGDKDTEKAVEIARKGLEDESSHVRYEAIGAISWLYDEDSNDKLKEMMEEDSAPQVRGYAMETLNWFGVDISDTVMEVFKSDIKDDDPEKEKEKAYMKSKAMYILANNKDKEIIPDLILLLDDETENYISVPYINGPEDETYSYSAYGGNIREAAIYALETVTDERFEVTDEDGWYDYPAVAEKWKEWYKENK